MASNVTQPSDEFMDLLTDALRAGPGSPEWHQAVLELRKQGEGAGDEYRLLWTARERLASGKSYREIRPGPAFTRKVLDQIDRLPVGGKKRPVPIATVVAIVSMLILIGVVAVVAYWIYHTPASDHPAGPKEDVATLVFPTTFLEASFDDSIPPDWRSIGSMRVVADHGLKPAARATAPPAADYAGGGIVSTSPVSLAGEPFELTAEFTGPIPDGVVPQIFVTDRSDFSPDRGISSHELVWTVQDGHAEVVLPGGHVADTRTPLPPDTTSLTVRMVIGHDHALVTLNGQPLWSGPHNLSPTRRVGVRFLQPSAAAKPGSLALQSLRVQKSADAR